MQSHGEKQVKNAKEEKKRNLIDNAIKQVNNHAKELNDSISPLSVTQYTQDWSAVIKGKRNFDSMKDALDAHAANIKIELTEQAQDLRTKLDLMEELAKGFEFLFNDLHQVVENNSLESLEIVVKERVSKYQTQQEEIAQQQSMAKDKEVTPEQPVIQGVDMGQQDQTISTAKFGDYEPLPKQYWPSPEDCMENETLAILCAQLQEAEAYIEMLTADKAA